MMRSIKTTKTKVTHTNSYNAGRNPSPPNSKAHCYSNYHIMYNPGNNPYAGAQQQQQQVYQQVQAQPQTQYANAVEQQYVPQYQTSNYAQQALYQGQAAPMQYATYQPQVQYATAQPQLSSSTTALHSRLSKVPSNTQVAQAVLPAGADSANAAYYAYQQQQQQLYAQQQDQQRLLKQLYDTHPQLNQYQQQQQYLQQQPVNAQTQQHIYTPSQYSDYLQKQHEQVSRFAIPHQQQSFGNAAPQFGSSTSAPTLATTTQLSYMAPEERRSGLQQYSPSDKVSHVKFASGNLAYNF